MGLVEKVLEYQETACWCGIAVLAPADLYKTALREGKTLYCVFGHTFGWNGENEKLKRQLAEAQAATSREIQAKWKAQAEAEVAERKLKKLKKRVTNGVCPHCQRTFTNLARHCKTKHPGVL